jgi:hypothetical protein
MATGDAWMKQPASYSSFAARIAPDGSQLMYFTYVGAHGGYSKAQAIAVDAHGRAWVSGHTTSKQFPVTGNAIQAAFAGGNRDAFLVRLTPDGSSVDYVSYLGGSFNGNVDPDETAAALRLDARGYLLVAGETHSLDFPGRRAVQETLGGMQDAYLIKLDADNRQIVYSTFWGGSKKDLAVALAAGPGEQVTIAGVSYSEDLPLANAVQQKLGSSNDGFVAQICDPWLGSWPESSLNLGYVRGGERPAPVELTLYTGCPQEFEASELGAEAEWVVLTPDKQSLPMNLKVEVNVDGMEPGEHKAVIRVVVPDAYLPTLEIPVTVTVSDPPPVE